MARKFFTQMKYLFTESLKIINEFGIKYYFNFGINQLQKQKLKLFFTDENDYIILKDDKILNPAEQYSFWKKTKTFENDSIKTDLEQLPKITIMLNLNSSKTMFVKSIKSIVNQSYSNWELFLVGKFFSNSELKQMLSFLDDDVFEKIFLAKTSNELSFNEITSMMNGDFLCIMNKNVILQNNTFLLIAKSVSDKINFDILYSDEEIIFNKENKIQPFFKPDWSPYLFLQTNFVGNLFILSKKLLSEVKITDEVDFTNTENILQYYVSNTKNIFHLSEILFSTSYESSYDFNPFFDREHVLFNLGNKNSKITIQETNNKICKINFELIDEPKVSIIIPTKNNYRLLSECIRSLEYNTNYENFEIIILDNKSDGRTTSYLSSLPYQVISFDGEFNFSQMNNIALEKSTGDYVLFLNDDTESIEPNWLSEMISICHQNDVGAVGAKLLYNDNTIQHAGMAHLKNGFFFHPLQKFPSNSDTQFNTLNLIHECSSVTGACLLTKREILKQIKNFDEIFDVYYGDSDLCFKIRDLGYSIIFTPYAILRHDGSGTIRKQSKIFLPTENFHDFVTKWPIVKNGDPYYNSNFSFDYDLDIPYDEISRTKNE